MLKTMLHITCAFKLCCQLLSKVKKSIAVPIYAMKARRGAEV